MVRIELRKHLSAHPASAGEARRFVRSALADWGASNQRETAALLVTEVVTNAILHTRSGPDLMARLAGRRLRVEVRDDDPSPPHRRPYKPLATTGRGLILVDELASAWGSEPAGSGKIVWFELESGVPMEDSAPHDRRLVPAHDVSR
jgi:anti-sigma regulatory factor (Ser/Thr protein kinase)